MSKTSSIMSQPNRKVQINPTSGDRVNALLIASLVMFGFLFTVLFTVWWFHEPPVARRKIDPWDTEQPLVTPDDVTLDFVEFESSEGAPLEELIETVGPSIEELSDANGILGNGVGTDPGFGRDPRTIPTSGLVAPRWSVVQKANDLESYQQKLDFFGIEIGAVHKTQDQVWRIAKLSTEKTVTESTRSAEAKTRYFVSQKKRLPQWDRQMIANAGVDVKDVIAVHFYPDKLVATMQQLVDVEYGERSSELQEVTFKIAGTAGDLHFEIDNVKFDN